MTSRFARITALTGLIGLLACSGNVIAVVDGVPITQRELTNAVAIANRNFDPVYQQTPEHQQQIQRQLLDTMIDERLVEQALTRQATLPTDAEITQALDEYKGTYTDESFAEMLQKKGLTYDTWKAIRRRAVLVERFREQIRHTLPAASLSDIKSYYSAHPDEFQQPHAVHVRHLIVEQASQAKKLLAELKSGGNFAHLASEHSIAPEALQGGDLGWIEQRQFPAAFAACFTLPVGALSDVVQSEYGFHIFKIIARRPARTITLEQAKPMIEERVLTQQLETAVANAIAGLRATARIELKPIPLTLATRTGEKL